MAQATRRAGPRRRGTTHNPNSSSGATTSLTGFDGWEQRIYSGLMLGDVPADVRDGLARALGAVGVEAEHLLRVLAAFDGASALTRAAGEQFLDQLESFARRFPELANELELAAQSYATALWSTAHGGPRSPAPDQPWWPPFAGFALGGEPLELRLRRCSFSYRQAVALRLGPTVEALAEQMALLLHALRTLPPAGTVSPPVLVAGLDELADALQADVAGHLLRDASDDFPGLLSVARRLRESGANAPLADDLAWARGEYQQAAKASAESSSRVTKPGLIARLFHGAQPMDAAQRWSQSAAQEWRELIAALEGLQAASQEASQRGRV